MNVILVHGSYGSPDENWFPWLKAELEKLGCTVIVPQFPTPENQSLETWKNVLEGYSEYLDDAIVVGHSLAPAFLLHVLEKRSFKAVFFVSSFIGLLDNPDFDSINATFVKGPFDWSFIKSHCSSFHVYHSDNDPYVPLESGKEVAEKLGVDLIVVKNAGHFNEDAGYTKFDMLLENIKEIINCTYDT